MQVKDISSGEGDVATFHLVQDLQPWEVPLESAFSEPENPVPFTGPGNAGFGGQTLQNGHQPVPILPC